MNNYNNRYSTQYRMDNGALNPHFKAVLDRIGVKVLSTKHKDQAEVEATKEQVEKLKQERDIESNGWNTGPKGYEPDSVEEKKRNPFGNRKKYSLLWFGKDHEN